MKFYQLATTALFAINSISGATIFPRQDQQQQNGNQSQYPSSVDIGQLNGTWYLTGLTSNLWDLYQTYGGKLGISANCLQVDLTNSSSSELEAIGSGFFNRTSSGVGVNATAAGAFYLSGPTSDLDVSANDLAWSAYVSQVFVNKAQWQNFVSNGQGGNSDNTTDGGSEPIPGSKTMQATINTRLINSSGNSGDNSTNFDTLFVWGSHAQTVSKRADDVYGAILSRNPSVDQDTFSRTLGLLPSGVTNTTLVLLDDSCNTQQ
ncbi:hypothetical protein G6F57_006615 [Rhizopus arrhizus]|uniref:Lipocalin-like domain-containing protein n=1 Tax=Rhizopus oryzae TaxID=64495 RepID=A0A9P6X8N2_RHIOR|nr:hypothetical protein G6F23_002985 [Rhizopus arrhizus]KAG1419980.1 hypothetical protein G6F58_004375 [Rhizopus delemar]KAG0767030.1 hypothetical protein G6F24_003132 [Rhizopus arrhizus]KAG0788555.1 hypothetical protein G6F21_007135 [Rhizopus arrhizus]KAG0793429.1 hypothetical protein G6F22_005606 [Rhizopus arrhizus]